MQQQWLLGLYCTSTVATLGPMALGFRDRCNKSRANVVTIANTNLTLKINGGVFATDLPRGLVWSVFYTPRGLVWSGLVWSGLYFIPNLTWASTMWPAVYDSTYSASVCSMAQCSFLFLNERTGLHRNSVFKDE